MPIYEFQCDKCGRIFEELFMPGFKESRVFCRKCNAVARKILSAPNFKFNGTGFYATDYKKPAGRVKEDKDGNA